MERQANHTTCPDLSAFQGRWRLMRVIRDGTGLETARMEGVTAFSEWNGGLRQQESGTLSMGGVTMEAQRVYHWQIAPDGIEVRFEDGRLFHAFGQSLDVRHDCAPDLYLGTYDFADWPIWTLTWRVSGPRKDYTSVSTYTRLPTCA